MAFGNAGATWLQLAETVSNPYFGATMLRCGEVIRVLRPSPPSVQGDGEPSGGH